MNLMFPETIKAAKDLQSTFKCLFCKKLPEEPYFTGVCDHLLCLDCLENVNACPICGVIFYKKESHLNKMIKEAILYVKNIIECTDDENNLVKDTKDTKLNDWSDDSLPDVSIRDENEPPEKNSVKQKFENHFPEPKLPPPKQITRNPIKNLEDTTSQLEPVKSTQQRAKRKTSTITTTSTTNLLSTQTKSRAASTVRQPTNKAEVKKIEDTQRSRSQSVKKTRKNDKGETPLHLASMNGDLNELEELLKNSTFDPNVKDFAGWTPLHEACIKGHLEVIKLLLEHNADINAMGYQNNTPLHEAVLNKNFECVKYLLEQGADQTIRNNFGILPKDFVKSNKEMISLFESYPNDSNNHNINNVDYLNSSCININNQSQLDSTISSSFRESKRTRQKPKKIVLFGTGMNDEDKVKLNVLASKLNLQIAKDMNNNVTHVIFTSEKICFRTLNYMKAILMGIWIVSIKWLEESVNKGGLVQENEYEAEGSQKIPNSNGPFKGRMNASCQYPKLFEDCNFYLYGDFKVFEKSDLIKLIEMAGGKILKREPKLDRINELIPLEQPYHLASNSENNSFICSNFILYDATKLTDISHKHLCTVKPNWLFSSIDEFKILNPETCK